MPFFCPSCVVSVSLNKYGQIACSVRCFAQARYIHSPLQERHDKCICSQMLRNDGIAELVCFSLQYQLALRALWLLPIYETPFSLPF